MNHKTSEEKEENEYLTRVHFEGEIRVRDGSLVKIDGTGSGPIEAFFNALGQVGITGYKFVDYSEHAISVGEDSKAISYIHLKNPQQGHFRHRRFTQHRICITQGHNLRSKQRSAGLCA